MYGGNPEIGPPSWTILEVWGTNAAARRLAQGITFALSILVILWVGGLEFAQRPVGVAYLVLWAALAFATAIFRRPGAPSRFDRNQIAWRSILGVFGFLAIMIVGPWEYTHMTGPIPRDGLVAWAGIGLFALGVAINAWSMATLRSLYTVRLAIQADHHLVTSGPYRMVRHPGYFGFVLAFPGMALALGSLSMIAVAGATIVWIVQRIGAEEAMLLEQFGDEYRAYQGRTKRLIPFVY